MSELETLVVRWINTMTPPDEDMMSAESLDLVVEESIEAYENVLDCLMEMGYHPNSIDGKLQKDFH